MTTLAKSDTNGNSFGGFVGYNFQFEDAVLGFEVNYSRMSLNAGATDFTHRSYMRTMRGHPPAIISSTILTVDGTAAIRITDLMTLPRAGGVGCRTIPALCVRWVRDCTRRCHSIRDGAVHKAGFSGSRRSPIDPIPDAPFDQSRTEVKDGGFYGGYTGGLGLEWAVFPNVFLRGEWEYVVLPNIQGLGININTFRAGIGMRF